MKLRSTAFEHLAVIPHLYTCMGEELSPPLSWEDPPVETKSFALYMEDISIPWHLATHWILYNIPPDKRGILENVPRETVSPEGMVQARNSYLKNSYLGPCPPWGSHRYEFTLYALDQMLEPDPRTTRRRFLRSIKGHVLGEAHLIGVYSRKGSSG